MVHGLSAVRDIFHFLLSSFFYIASIISFNARIVITIFFNIVKIFSMLNPSLGAWKKKGERIFK